MPEFRIVSDFEPAGDQAQAIEKLVEGINNKVNEQVLLGITGSGKTYTIAKVIEETQRPALIVAHNKTLAAQLYQEFKEFFPHNAVEYFVSYYDYYQPEAYIVRSDTFIEKDASINDEIDRLRHSATKSVHERRDVIIVASVSCIYSMGSPDLYYEQMIELKVGMEIDRDDLLMKFIELQYSRNDYELKRGTFRVRGDVIEIFSSYEDSALRIELFGDEIDCLSLIDPVTGLTYSTVEKIPVYPKTHYVTTEELRQNAFGLIRKELKARIKELHEQKKYGPAERLMQRTTYDLEMLKEIGYCYGVENYSRHLSGRKEGEPPATLLDYMPEGSLMIIDESHATIPQIRGMYNGDRSRKSTLVEYGFRLPSALDNRPLKFEEFEERKRNVIYVSATPGDYEMEKTGGEVVEQIIRPTGLMDPVIEVRPISTQVDDLLHEIRTRAEKKERILVTTLTKKMAEELSRYYSEVDVKTKYLHSDIDTMERVEILRELREGIFDVLIGVNLLREGLDLPEVSLVAIMDADKEGFLRSARALIQTSGRAARNVNGKVIFYADKITKSMQEALSETERRRKIQAEFNKKHGIIPKTIKKGIAGSIKTIYEADYFKTPKVAEEVEKFGNISELEKEIKSLRKEMKKASDKLEFEKAAVIRDKIKSLKQLELFS